MREERKTPDLHDLYPNQRNPSKIKIGTILEKLWELEFASAIYTSRRKEAWLPVQRICPMGHQQGGSAPVTWRASIRDGSSKEAGQRQTLENLRILLPKQLPTNHDATACIKGSGEDMESPFHRHRGLYALSIHMKVNVLMLTGSEGQVPWFQCTCLLADSETYLRLLWLLGLEVQLISWETLLEFPVTLWFTEHCNFRSRETNVPFQPCESLTHAAYTYTHMHINKTNSLSLCIPTLIHMRQNWPSRASVCWGEVWLGTAVSELHFTVLVVPVKQWRQLECCWEGTSQMTTAYSQARDSLPNLKKKQASCMNLDRVVCKITISLLKRHQG